MPSPQIRWNFIRRMWMEVITTETGIFTSLFAVRLWTLILFSDLAAGERGRIKPAGGF